VATNSSHPENDERTSLELVPTPTLDERVGVLERQMEGLADFVAQLWRGDGSVLWDPRYDWNGDIPSGAWAVTYQDGTVEQF
jgi:hypothetical protein